VVLVLQQRAYSQAMAALWHCTTTATRTGHLRYKMSSRRHMCGTLGASSLHTRRTWKIGMRWAFPLKPIHTLPRQAECPEPELLTYNAGPRTPRTHCLDPRTAHDPHQQRRLDRRPDGRQVRRPSLHGRLRAHMAHQLRRRVPAHPAVSAGYGGRGLGQGGVCEQCCGDHGRDHRTALCVSDDAM
jgi:hypothetical protein